MTEFLISNWLWIILLVVMFTMHRRGGCGVHNNHSHQKSNRDTKHVHHPEQGKNTL